MADVDIAPADLGADGMAHGAVAAIARRERQQPRRKPSRADRAAGAAASRRIDAAAARRSGEGRSAAGAGGQEPAPPAADPAPAAGPPDMAAFSAAVAQAAALARPAPAPAARFDGYDAADGGLDPFSPQPHEQGPRPADGHEPAAAAGGPGPETAAAGGSAPAAQGPDQEPAGTPDAQAPPARPAAAGPTGATDGDLDPSGRRPDEQGAQGAAEHEPGPAADQSGPGTTSAITAGGAGGPQLEQAAADPWTPVGGTADDETDHDRDPWGEQDDDPGGHGQGLQDDPAGWAGARDAGGGREDHPGPPGPAVLRLYGRPGGEARRRGPRPARAGRARRAGLALGALAAAAAITVAAGALLGGPGTDPAPVPAPSPAAAAAGEGVRMQPWRGIGLPTGSAGPAIVQGDMVEGFADTDLGAATAAAHLSVRLDPAAGPATFGPVVQQQAVGARDRLAAALQAQYAEQAAAAGIADGGPLPTEPGLLLGYRVARDGAAADVHLLVAAPDGTRTDYLVPLARAGGDWAVDVPAAGPVFALADPAGDYTPFPAEEPR